MSLYLESVHGVYQAGTSRPNRSIAALSDQVKFRVIAVITMHKQDVGAKQAELFQNLSRAGIGLSLLFPYVDGDSGS